MRIEGNKAKELVGALRLAQRAIEQHGFGGMDQNPLGVRDVIGSVLIGFGDNAGMSPTTVRVLKFVDTCRDSVSAASIANALNINSRTATDCLGKLAAAGFTRSQRAVDNQKTSYWVTTLEGRRKAREL